MESAFAIASASIAASRARVTRSSPGPMR
jgi:hypothetical protein